MDRMETVSAARVPRRRLRPRLPSLVSDGRTRPGGMGRDAADRARRPGDAQLRGRPGNRDARLHLLRPRRDDAHRLLEGRPRARRSHVQVLDPDLQPIDTASHLKGNKIKKLPLPTRGRHTIQVQTTAGAGHYSLKTSAKYPRRATAARTSTRRPTGNFEFELGLPAGTRLSAKVKKAKGSSRDADVRLARRDRRAPSTSAQPNPTSFKKVPITATGLFTLAIAGGNGGQIDLDDQAQVPGREDDVYTFDAVETDARHRRRRSARPGSAPRTPTSPSEPFAHWNNESPAVVPQSCAKCHSGLGYQDFLGVLANPHATPPETRAHART